MWPTYVLDCEEMWPMHDSLSYYMIIQLKQCFQQLDRWDEIHYINVFMSLHNRILPDRKSLDGTEEGGGLKPLSDSRT